MDSMKKDLPPHMELALMSRWYIVSRCLHVAAELGIANHITPEGSHVTELAAASHTQPTYLLRFLRYLASYGVFQETAPETFNLTPLAEPLRDDAAISLRPVLRMVDGAWWKAAGNLQHTLETGEAAFQDANGAQFFDYLAQSSERQQRFDDGMAMISTFDDGVVAAAIDFSPFDTVVDVGGGQGGLLAEICKINPHVQGLLFDQEYVVAHAKPLIKANVQDRCECISGDFFAELPKDKDLYIYKGVLHDFNDDLVIQLLSNCREHMNGNSKVIVAEQMIPDTDAPHPNKTMDMVMMMLLDGRQRTIPGWKTIAEQAGFTVSNTIETNSLFTCIELSKI